VPDWQGLRALEKKLTAQESRFEKNLADQKIRFEQMTQSLQSLANK
jgi:hypothetical protein